LGSKVETLDWWSTNGDDLAKILDGFHSLRRLSIDFKNKYSVAQGRRLVKALTMLSSETFTTLKLVLSLEEDYIGELLQPIHDLLALPALSKIRELNFICLTVEGDDDWDEAITSDFISRCRHSRPDVTVTLEVCG